MTDFDTRPRYGHNHNGVYEPLWSKITYMAHAKRHVMVRRPHCDPFVLTEKQWLEFPLWSDRPAGRSALAQSEDARKKGRCYIFDIDGTLADCSHRLHHIQKHPKDWDGFFAECHLDAPHTHIIGLAKDLMGMSVVVFVSGRSDQRREQTVEWLLKHGLPSGPLYMRKAGDRRDDDIIKLEILAELREDGFDPVMAFDDRNRVVKAWRAAGIPCAQVAEGDF